MIYISYYTEGIYEEVMNKYLLPSLKKWKLKYDIQCLPSLGSWSPNVALKPKFILDMLNKHNEDIVFLDADATIESFPDLFATLSANINVAAHYLDWKTWYGKGNKKELLTGTLFLQNTPAVKRLCEEWYETAKKTNRWEQAVLADILKTKPNIKVYELPLSYCYIKSRPGNKQPLVLLNPVILHHQCSRKYKRWKL